MKKLLGIVIILLAGCAGQEVQQATPLVNEEVAAEEGAEYYLDRGYRELSQRNPKKAIRELDLAIARCQRDYPPDGPVVFASRGPTETIYYLLTAAAEEESRDTITIGPACAEALYLKGYAMLDLGEVEQAHTLVAQAIAMAPVNSRFLSELGHIYHTKREWEKALAAFVRAEEAAETFSPDDVKELELSRAKRGVGYSLIELGRLDEAESKFNECLDINNDDERAKRELDYIRHLRENPQTETGTAL